jgi:cytosine/adenosine deaminase-related metal-dependent hydrolase
MMRGSLGQAIACLAGLAAMLLAPVPAAAAAGATTPLATPPANAQTWDIVSGGRKFGLASRWTTPDGVRWARDTMSERSYNSDLEQRMRLSADGVPLSLSVRGSLPHGDAAESFSRLGGDYAYRSGADQGQGRGREGAFYVPMGGAMDSVFALVEALAKAPGHALDLIPSGRAELQPLTTLELVHDGKTRTLTAELITGLDLSPQPIWMDGDQVFAMVGDFSVVPTGWDDAAARLIAAQDAAMARRAPELIARIAAKLSRPVAFTHVRLYDSDARRFRDDMTVVVEAGRVASVGPAAAVKVPPGARIVAGQGKTLLPGLWDSHKHYGDDASGALLLAQGITTVRDMGSVPAALQTRRKRIDSGQLLGPRIVPLLLIDGPGKDADFVAVVVADEAEAIAAVRRAKAEGYFGVKIYGALDPALIAPVAREAHRLGLRLQGHLPRTVRPLDAVRQGYDEVTHMNFVLMQAMPDSVVDETFGLRQRHFGPGSLGGDVDLDAPAMKAALDEMVARHTAFDPTLAVFEGLWATDAGEVAPSYRPFLGTLPPQFERNLHTGGLTLPKDVTRAQMRRGFAKLKELTMELHRRGAPILAGTDGVGLELVRELELYVQTGFTPEDALASATIVPAQVMGLDAETGSLAGGKLADLVLVDGDPGHDIGDLRRVELVMRDGRLMGGEDLRTAAGLSGAPKAEAGAGAG